jgi:hypothetical protein
MPYHVFHQIDTCHIKSCDLVLVCFFFFQISADRGLIVVLVAAGLVVVVDIAVFAFLLVFQHEDWKNPILVVSGAIMLLEVIVLNYHLLIIAVAIQERVHRRMFFSLIRT